jgi:hypothetical protein
MDNKLGVIVPYRNREEHLTIFKQSIKEYLNKTNITFELIIVEQYDDKPFNRGKLLNIGFLEAEKLGCSYVVFHDVDILPIKADYSFSNVPIHLATDNIPFESYFGGVTIFPLKDFIEANGFPNEYWGWGFEDDELLRRTINTTSQKIRNRKTGADCLVFNGKDCYVKIPNNIDFKKDIKFSIVFEVTPTLNEVLEFDEWTIFSIPGWDLTLTYNSFGRYKFELWDFKRNCYSINSKILSTYITKIDITISVKDCLVIMNQNREYVGDFKYNKRLLDYSNEEWIYLGNANPYRGSNMKELNGMICEFKVWNDLEEIINFDFKKCTEYYGCEKDITSKEQYKFIKLPYRRNSIFKKLKHDENGFVVDNWKSKNTRVNQIKYSNSSDKSGLNNIDYTIIENINNHIKVKL